MNKQNLQLRANRGLTTDLLKTVAAMIVFFLHGRTFLPEADQMTGCMRWVTYFPAWGGVWLFLILSGYGIGTGFFQGKYPLTGPDGRISFSQTFRFYIGRLLKTAPFYYLYCLLFELFSGHLFFWQNPGIGFKMLTFTFNGNGGINGLGHLWYLSMAVQLYLFMPFLYLGIEFLCKTGKAFAVTFITVLVLGLALRVSLYQAGRDWYTQIYTNCLVNLDLVAAGMLTAKAGSGGLLTIKQHRKEKIKIMGVAVFLVLILYNCSIYAAGAETDFFIYRCVLPSVYIVTSTLLLFVSGCRENDAGTGMVQNVRKIAANVVRWFSRCSYVFYVLHIVVLDYLGKSLATAEWFLKMHPNRQYVSFFAAALGILLPLSAVLTRWNVDLVSRLRKIIGSDTG